MREPRIIKAAIGVATYRRPDRLKTLLQSLAAQTFQSNAPELRIVIVDNDAQESAKAVCKAFEDTPGNPRLVYVREPRQGLSYARNAAVEAALGCDFLAFIDDDEIATPHWLDALLKRQAETGAVAVVGSVNYRLPAAAPDWVRRGAFFDSPPMLGDGAEALCRGSHNLLLSCDFLRRSGLRFDTRFNTAGGEDEFFFRSAIRRHGMSIAGAKDALVEEPVAPGRVSLNWLMQRRFRYGNTLARCDIMLKAGIGALGVRAAKGCGRVAMGLGVAAFGGLTGRFDRTAQGLTMASFGLGMIAGLSGITHRPYTPTAMKAEIQ